MRSDGSSEIPSTDNDVVEGEDLGSTTLSLEEAEPSDTGVGVEETRENVRGVLASVLVGVLATVAVGAMLLLAGDYLTSPEFESVSQLILTPLVAIVGSVVGFYFGGQTAQNAANGEKGKRKKLGGRAGRTGKPKRR